ncbi:hypothetical protein N7528_002276 [Penicillium herquei]|nr:hypothetical protein N7528_002276 [Penicillium herquei]
MSYADLKGKVYFLTGTASGQGRATAISLAGQGAKLGLLDMRYPQGTLDEIAKIGGEAVGFEVDVTDSAGIEAAVKATVEKFGQLDGAANLAGWIGTQGFKGKGYALDVIKDEEWDKMMAVNLNGVRNSLSAEMRYIREGGSIVNIASIAGQRGSPWNAPYGAAKWGVISLTKSAAQELGSKNVRVNAIAPGVIDTALATALGDPDVVFQRMVSRCALQRMGQPQEIANCILFLLSDVSSFVSGSVINADGGFQ